VFKKGDKVRVQIGPNLEDGTIHRAGKYGRQSVKISGKVFNVEDERIIMTEEAKVLAESVTELPEVKPPVLVESFTVVNPLPAVYDAAPTEEASAYVISDEWYGQIEQGDPFLEAADPYEKANPGRKFRYLGETTVKRHGKRGYQEVIDKQTGKPVTVSGMTLASIPRHVHEERARRVAQLTDDQAASKQEPIREQLAEAGKAAGIGTAALDAFDTAKTLREGIRGSEFRR